MNDLDDFIIEYGVLVKYTGKGGEVVIPACVTEIGADAFECFPLISKVTIEGAKYIDTYAFSCCENLTEVVLSDSVEEIAPYAFSDCHNLANLYIGKGLKRVGRSAFEGSRDSLENVYYGGDAESWENIDFDEYSYPLVTEPNFYIKNANGDYEQV